MEKINLVELLKDCPKGMELDCTMFEDIEFDSIVDNDCFPILCHAKNSNDEYNFYSFTKHGYWNNDYKAKCVIFPKGKTTWEGFVPPCKFKAGDVLYVDCADEESDGDLYKYIFILKEIDNLGNHFSYCHLYRDKLSPRSHYLFGNRYTPRLATEEEKQKLFQAIKENSYKWNAETKTLEKLPKFKIGNKIRLKENHNYIYTITGIREEENKYECGVTFVLRFSEQDNWELVPNKFDITTLKPFESRVLVRGDKNSYWKPAIFGCYMKNMTIPYYALGGTCWSQCIPYESNEHLLSTTEDCDEYYKTWK